MAGFGTLWGVSVGPGDPELMTLLAVRTIRRCPVIAAPRTESGRTLALDIAAQAADLTGKTVLPLDFTMAPRKESRREAHAAAEAALAEHLAAGRDVAFLTLGDVSVYSTFDCVEPGIRARGFETRRIPGVPSFCAAAAALDLSLGEGDDPVRLLPGGMEGRAEELGRNGTAVLMKTRDLAGVREALREAGRGDRAFLVQNYGLPEERIRRGLEEPWEDGYFSVVIVKE